MTIRVLAAIFVLVLAAPAYAQDAPRYDVSGGYSFLRDGDLEENFHGWLASITGNLTSAFGITGEVGGNYKGFETTFGDVDTSLHSFMAGPRFTARGNPAITPFAQVLFGGVRFSASDDVDEASETAFAIQPGGGVDFWANPNFGVRVGADFRRSFWEGAAGNQFRFHVGVVLAGGAR